MVHLPASRPFKTAPRLYTALRRVGIPLQPALPPVSQVHSVSPVYLLRPSSVRRRRRVEAACPAAYRRASSSIAMAASQQRPTALPVRGQKPVQRVTDQLEKPSLDDRTYRVIRLPNELEVLLVHDPETDKASAAMDVHVGAFSDEEDMPGMAHAVEHVRVPKRRHWTILSA